MFEGLDSNVEFGKHLQEHEFTYKSGTVPLNHGSYGAVPRRIQQQQIRFLEEMDSQPDLWFRESAYEYWNQSVEAAAKFFNCGNDELVFITNATSCVNTIVKAYDFKEGESILTSSLTFTPTTLAIKEFAERAKFIKLDMVDILLPISSEEEVINIYDDYLNCHPNTRMVIIDHITSPSGVLMPVKKIAKICKEHGALVVVDGAHAPGHIPVDVRELDVDFYIGNFHKWLFTPRGCAFLYAKKKHHDWLKPLVTSWKFDKSFVEKFSYIGTRDQIPFFCSKYALEFFEKIGGMDRIGSYCSTLATKAQEHLVKVLKTAKMDIPKEMEAPNIKLVLLPEVKGIENYMSFSLYFYKKTNIQTLVVRIQDRYFVRLSTSVYNYMEEYETFGEVLLKHLEQINNSYKAGDNLESLANTSFNELVKG